MPTYVVLADVHEQEFQNFQELVAIWGEIQTDIEGHGGTLRDSYALMGEYDFLLSFEADDDETALRIAVAIERYGLETGTMPAFPTDSLGDLVDDE